MKLCKEAYDLKQEKCTIITCLALESREGKMFAPTLKT